MAELTPAFARVVREHHGRLVAALARTTRGDLELAEDALQAAVEAALHQWPTEGVPVRPEAWLLRVARFKLVDQLRRHRRWSALVDELPPGDEAVDDTLDELPDDRLWLICTCCHPALALPAQVALTLRTVCGLTTEEIARAFLVDAPTMAQRLVRAQRKIRDARIPYEVPGPDGLPARLAGVLHVVYLVYTEGYAATQGEALVRGDLCEEALRLAGLLAALVPAESEVHGLVALLLFHDARRGARVDPFGALVLLEDQDRSRWDPVRLRAGFGALRAALDRGPPGVYTLQAAIASVHARARTPDETAWREILALYDLLQRALPSDAVALNRAVAVGMVQGPAAGLAALPSDGPPGHLRPAVEADFLRRLGDPRAAACYRRALDLVGTTAERAFLLRRLAEVEGT